MWWPWVVLGRALVEAKINCYPALPRATLYEPQSNLQVVVTHSGLRGFWERTNLKPRPAATSAWLELLIKRLQNILLCLRPTDYNMSYKN